jgi:uncharacterized protein YvpB
MKRIFRILTLVTILTVFHTSPARGDSLPDSAYIFGVSGHAQGYSLSCEARSAADVAAFWGISISETEFLQAIPLADNPEEGFVGSPSDTWGNIPPLGYGVHAGPVAETLQDFGIATEAHHDLTWDDLRAEIVAERPVIVWVIGQMWGGTPVEYEAPDGSTARVAAFEHTMILTGYSKESVQVVDAYTGMYQSYRLSAFEKSWAVLGNMAVFSSGAVSNNDTSRKPEAYTVQPGDYLVALAERFGTTWQELAKLNKIGYPYTIFSGQVLYIPGGEAQEAETPPGLEDKNTTPASPTRVVNFEVSLPMVQRNFSHQNAPLKTDAPLVAETPLTITVRNLNTLAGFCKSLGLDWRLLVKVNNLRPPYLVYPGQVLRLR